MNTIRSMAATLLVAATLISACAPRQSGTSARLGQEFILAPGQSASIVGEPLTIRFAEVVTDSRCPTGVVCIWEGEVSSLLDVTYQGQSTSMTLTTRGSSQGEDKFAVYSLAFNVAPYPQAGKQIAKQDYRLRLVVRKNSD